MDKVSLDRINLLHPAIRDEVKALYNIATQLMPSGTILRITQGLRTVDEQNRLYAQGRTLSGKIVTKAKGGSSYHNYGLAFDFCLVKDGKVSWEVNNLWLGVVKLFTDAGYTWGGNFKSIKDYPHLEKTFGYNWKELLQKHNKKDFITGTEYVNI